MKSRSEFCQAIASLNHLHVERAVALLWYYRQTQEYEERSASELANDLHDEGFPKANVTRLDVDLRRSPSTIRGRRSETFQLDVRRLPALDQMYLSVLGTRVVEVKGSILDPDMVAGTRVYLEKLVHQINGTYEYGFFDACAVLCRRLMEALIIEVYQSSGRHHEIQQNGKFLTLDRLVPHICNDKTITLGRGTAKTMDEVKQVGDTAAHDRTYITQPNDLDDLKARYRKMISELLNLSGILK